MIPLKVGDIVRLRKPILVEAQNESDANGNGFRIHVQAVNIKLDSTNQTRTQFKRNITADRRKLGYSIKRR
jgi:hypothetical protein